MSGQFCDRSNWWNRLAGKGGYLFRLVTVGNRKSFWCDNKSVWLCFCCYYLRLKVSCLLIRLFTPFRLEIRQIPIVMGTGRSGGIKRWVVRLK